MGRDYKMTTEFDADEMPKWLSSLIPAGKYNHVLAGINDDDCAVIKIGEEELVITTDYLNARPITLELGIGDFWDLGRILVASNLSDLCSTGAIPVGFLTSIMLDREVASEEKFKAFMNGVKYELEKHNIPLVGGDTKLGGSDSFCGTAFGVKDKKSKLMLKNAAQIGDSIWVSGNLGGVAAAIEGLKSDMCFDENWVTWAKNKIINPKIPIEKSRLISNSGLGNGGTDISDGLGANLWDLCEASGVGARVDVVNIPFDIEVEILAKSKLTQPWIYSLTIGGDFQFLVTSDSNNDKQVESFGFTKIGQIIEEKQAFLFFENQRITMPRMGHRDARKQSFSDEVSSLVNNIVKQLKND